MIDLADTMDRMRRASNGLSNLAGLTNYYYVDGIQIRNVLHNILEDLDDLYAEVERSLDESS